MAKRRTAEQSQDIIPADDEIANRTEQPLAANPAADIAAQATTIDNQQPPISQESSPPTVPDGNAPSSRQPGDDTASSWVKKASVIVDPEAGMKFHFDYEKHQAIITFNEKPTSEVLAVARPILNEGSFDWDKVNKDGWKKRISFQQREDDRREAKKTFYAVANAIREQKGLPTRHFGEAMAF